MGKWGEVSDVYKMVGPKKGLLIWLNAREKKNPMMFDIIGL